MYFESVDEFAKWLATVFAGCGTEAGLDKWCRSLAEKASYSGVALPDGRWAEENDQGQIVVE